MNYLLQYYEQEVFLLMTTTMSEENKKKWIKIIEDQKQSGLSILQYCKKHEFSDKTFYRYRKLLGLSTTQRFKAVTVEPQSKKMIQFYLDDIPIKMDTNDFFYLISEWKHKS